MVAAVDGRSAGGKSTVAGRLVEAIGDATVVHTDDVAWYHGFFDWAGLLVDGVLEPLARGEAVSFRPTRRSVAASSATSRWAVVARRQCRSGTSG